jgi:2-polyprenyl-3-methyl-5-hydroxy-6-metoxy-1,4-benzoquinol methylase
VPYSALPEFQALQSEESTPLYDTALVGAMLPLVPGIIERLEAGIEVADVGCGQGHAVNVMAQAFPNSTFVGYDFSEEGVAVGRAEAASLGLANARFEVRDVADLGSTAQFGLVTAFDTIHDQAHPLQVLRSIIGSLQPGGDFLMMDIASSSKLEENIEHPMGPLLYAASTFHCMTVSLAQGGDGVGTVWGEQKAAEYLRQAGFDGVQAKHLDGDFFHVFFVAKKGPQR